VIRIAFSDEAMFLIRAIGAALVSFIYWAGSLENELPSVFLATFSLIASLAGSFVEA